MMFFFAHVGGRETKMQHTHTVYVGRIELSGISDKPLNFTLTNKLVETFLHQENLPFAASENEGIL